MRYSLPEKFGFLYYLFCGCLSCLTNKKIKQWILYRTGITLNSYFVTNSAEISLDFHKKLKKILKISFLIHTMIWKTQMKLGMSQKVGEIAAEKSYENYFFSGLWPLFCKSVWPSGIDKCVTSDTAERKELKQADISWNIWKGGFAIEFNVSSQTVVMKFFSLWMSVSLEWCAFGTIEMAFCLDNNLINHISQEENVLHLYTRQLTTASGS